MDNKTFSLYESLTSFHTIHCDKCKKEDTIHSDDAFDASEVFYEDGWRVTNDTVYCKKCFKKKTKKNKKK